LTNDETERRAGDDAERRWITRAFRGSTALDGLSGLVAPSPPRLELVGTPLCLADAMTGIVIRHAVDRHHETDDPGRQVILREPKDERAHAFLVDLLGVLPRRTRWADGETTRRGEEVLLPTTSIADAAESKIYAEWLTTVAAAMRLPSRAAHLLTMSAELLTGFLLSHRPPSPPPSEVAPPLSTLACCYEAQGHNLQLVALGAPPSVALEEPLDFLRSELTRSANDMEELWSIATVARRSEIDATLMVTVGNGQFRHRVRRDVEISPERDVRHRSRGVPALVASLEIHLDGAARAPSLGRGR
jgi:hypothetical protein